MYESQVQRIHPDEQLKILVGYSERHSAFFDQSRDEQLARFNHLDTKLATLQDNVNALTLLVCLTMLGVAVLLAAFAFKFWW